MLKAVALVDESVMDGADYADLVKRYWEKADQISLMAYTSIWGEANSNAGKEIVDEYLERTKRSIISALKLEVLPPSDKKTLSTTEFQDLTGAINLKTKEDTNDQLILICSLSCFAMTKYSLTTQK